MSQPTLSFIVPTIDRRDSLLRCLASVAEQDYPHIEMIVVDDNSVDGSREAVMAAYPQTQYITNPGRVGIGPALAMGSKLASGTIYINLDDDGLLATPDAATKIAAYFESQPDLGAICFRCERPDGTIRHREIPLRSKKLPTDDTDIGYFLGGAVAFRASALDAIGGYPNVEYYSWEQDVSFRLHKAGYRIMYSPAIRFTHYAIPSALNTTGREAGYVRIQLRLAATYLPWPYAQVHAALWVAFCLRASMKVGELPLTSKAAAEALRGWPGLRADKTHRLTLREARSMSALSGRTWY